MSQLRHARLWVALLTGGALACSGTPAATGGSETPVAAAAATATAAASAQPETPPATDALALAVSGPHLEEVIGGEAGNASLDIFPLENRDDGTRRADEEAVFVSRKAGDQYLIVAVRD